MARKMKDSGIEWIGEFPRDWKTIRFKYVHSGTNVGESIDKDYWSTNTNDTVFYTAGLVPIFTSYNNFPGWKIVGEQDLLLARNGTPYIYLPAEGAVYSDHIIRVRIHESCDKRYFRYCLQQSILSEDVNVVSIATWSASLWNKQCLPLPDKCEQQAIADYLDKKCAQIDTALAKTRTAIEEYKKLKQAIITKAVTKGVRGNRPMKDSGIEWIGEIPAEWKVVSVKHLCTMQAGKTLTAEEISETGKYPVYGGNGIRGYHSAFNNDGDCILVGRQGALCGNVHMVSCKIWATEHAVITKPLQLSDMRYLYFLLIGMKLNQYASNSAAQPGLAVSSIINKKGTCPPLTEQQEIADYLDKKCATIDTLIAKKEQLITELEAYKKSLIYEYVTGKKEVLLNE